MDDVRRLPTSAGWYWYRSTAPHDPASAGDWVVLYVHSDGFAQIADTGEHVAKMKGEWRGPLVEPSTVGA